MFRAILCSSSGGSIVYTQHLVPYVSLFLGDCSVHRLLEDCALNSHPRRVIHKEPDAVYTGCNRRNGPDFGRVFLGHTIPI